MPISAPTSLPFVAHVAFAITQDADWRDAVHLVNGDPSLVGDWAGVHDPDALYQRGDTVLAGGVFYRASDLPGDMVPPDPPWLPVLGPDRLPLQAWDLTAAAVAVTIVPDYGWAGSPIMTLTSASGGGLLITDAINGGLEFDVSRTTIQGWPVGEWRYIARVRTTDSYDEIMRGPLSVFPRIF